MKLVQYPDRLIIDPFFGAEANAKVLNFVEAVLNLFMKLQTSNVIKLDNLGDKSMVNEVKNLNFQVGLKILWLKMWNLQSGFCIN